MQKDQLGLYLDGCQVSFDLSTIFHKKLPSNFVLKPDDLRPQWVKQDMHCELANYSYNPIIANPFRQRSGRKVGNYRVTTYFEVFE